jgi:hypothetical protein
LDFFFKVLFKQVSAGLFDVNKAKLFPLYIYIYIYLKEINFVYINVFMVSKAGSLLFSSPGCLIRQNCLLPFWISFFLSVFLVL